MYKKLNADLTITTYREWDEFRKLIPFSVEKNITFDVANYIYLDIDSLYKKLLFNDKMISTFETVLKEWFNNRKIVLAELATSYSTRSEKTAFTQEGVLDLLANEMFNNIVADSCPTAIDTISFASLFPNMPASYLPHPAYFLSYNIHCDIIRTDGKRILQLIDRLDIIDNLLLDL